MNGQTDQLVGALFRVLAEDGHTEAHQVLLEAYHEEATADRDELTQNLFIELITVLDEQLAAEAEVEVLTTAVEYLLDRLTAVIEAAPVGILVVDPQGAIQLWNRGAGRMFGWSEREMLQRSYPAALSTAPDTTESFLGRLREGEHLTGVETQHAHKDGSRLDVRVWAAPLQDSGSFGGATFVISDITVQKQREQRLAVLNRVLRHNIRNDLNVIRGHLGLLAEELADDNRHVAVMKQRLANIDDLSDAARCIEQLEGDDADLSTIDLSDVVDRRLDRLRAERPAAELTATLPDDARVVGHELLPYALDNVLDNALEHNSAESPRVDLTITEPEGQQTGLIVRIADDGPGLPKTEKDVLTEATETPLTHSSGMGLWLTRWIIRSSEGTLTVEPSRFDGTAIVFELQTPADG